MTSTLELYAARVRGAALHSHAPPVVGGGWNQKDARPCADRLQGYVKALAADVDARIVCDPKDPELFSAKLDSLVAAGLDETSEIIVNGRAWVKQARAVRKGKDDAQIKRELEFCAAFKSWRKKDWEPWYYGWPDGNSGLPGDPVDDGTYSRCLDFEAQFLKGKGWRPRFEALGYAPSTDAPTTVEVDASKPKDEGILSPLGGITGAISSLAHALPWVAAGVIGLVAFNAYKGRGA